VVCDINIENIELEPIASASGAGRDRTVAARGCSPIFNNLERFPFSEEDSATVDAKPVAWELDDPRLFINRELSWLDFDERVLAEAFDERNPLLERVRFLAISANNLDEFFMIRVSGLRKQMQAGVATRTPDGMSPREQLAAIDERYRRLLRQLAYCASDLLLPGLRKEQLGVCNYSELDSPTRAALSGQFRERIFPVVTPLAVDPAHPFPFLSNLSLNLAVELRDPVDAHLRFARVKVPSELLSRFVRLPDRLESVPLEQLMAAHLDLLFPGMEVVGCHAFRVIRDADLELEEDEAEDLVVELEDALRQRRFRSVVSLVVSPDMPAHLRELLATELGFDLPEVIEMPGLLGLAELGKLPALGDLAVRPDLRFPPFTPRTSPRLRALEAEKVDLFATLRRGDLLVHFPYDSFADSVEALIRAAVADPAVLAIKQTLYRTAENSSIMASLARAAEAGKQVVVVVEIKARFDEQRNIQWAHRLEDSGAHVVYGVMGLKTHAKALLVVRQEGDEIRRYVHIGTGNYNGVTARLYEDLGLFSCRPELGEDTSQLFNLMTGYSRRPDFRELCVAPDGLREALTMRIEREAAHARAGRPSRIVMKMNSLVDPLMIRALYQASQDGVEIDLIVRGICCLRPGLPGVSERIRVRSLIGRFLEHSRIFQFHNEGRPDYLIGSADLMPRNLDRRVEAVTQVSAPELQAELAHILKLCLIDTRQAWELRGDRWTRVSPRGEEPGLQDKLMQEALERRQT
jgi:polyphosphate kinase